MTPRLDRDTTGYMRCPHCATAVAAPPACHVCGSRLDVPAARQDRLDGLVPTSRESVDVDAEPVAGLEPTRIREPEVDVERMPDLIANEEVLGDTSIPADLPSDPPSVCPRCGAGHDGGRFCDRCGRTVNPVARDGADASEPPMVTCLECGVPNAQDRSLCMSCGNPL